MSMTQTPEDPERQKEGRDHPSTLEPRVQQGSGFLSLFFCPIYLKPGCEEACNSRIMIDPDKQSCSKAKDQKGSSRGRQLPQHLTMSALFGDSSLLL